MMPHGVGIIGAGPGVAALHVPTLARLAATSDRARLGCRQRPRRGSSPARSGLARRPASTNCSPIPASTSSSVCSPPAEHAEQVLASVAAGKRAIFCEKPLATTEADAAARDRGVPRGRRRAARRHEPPLRRGVGPRQASPARRRATGARDLGDDGAAAERPLPRRRDGTRAPAARPGRGGPDLAEPQVAASVVRQLLRDSPCTTCRCCATSRPVFERVVFARAVAPLGYAVGYGASGIPIRLATVMLPGRRRRALAPRHHDRRRADRGVLPAGVRARRAAPTCGCDSPTAASRRTRTRPRTAMSPSGARSPTC